MQGCKQSKDIWLDNRINKNDASRENLKEDKKPGSVAWKFKSKKKATTIAAKAETAAKAEKRGYKPRIVRNRLNEFNQKHKILGFSEIVNRNYFPKREWSVHPPARRIQYFEICKISLNLYYEYGLIYKCHYHFPVNSLYLESKLKIIEASTYISADRSNFKCRVRFCKFQVRIQFMIYMKIEKFKFL